MSDILYPPTIDWDFLFQRPQHLMLQFASNGWKVHYANKTQRYKDSEKITPNLFLYHDFSILLKRVKKVDILYISSPGQYYLTEKINSRIVIYDCVDKFSEWDKYEHKMLERADIVLTTSKFLYDDKNKYHENVYLVRNGCDYDHLQIKDKDTPPIDISRFKKPIIAFVGAVGKWVDKDILAYIAKKYTTILIGKEFGNNLPLGMINLGEKSYKELPFYYNNIDVGIIPFDQSETSRAANPIKMYEYLAAGKAVVGSKLPELEELSNVLYLADSPGAFVEKIGKALEDNNNELKRKRKKVARKNTWENRFDQIITILNNF